MRPSFLGLVTTGFLILIAFCLIIYHRKSIKMTEFIVVIILLSIAISVHSLQHNVEEIFYNFNPLIGKWTTRD